MKKSNLKRGAVPSTEEKIKAAAQKVFMQKGYGAARTRDIASAAGINLALLNYYFRSKEKLFHDIMIERIKLFFGTLAPLLNDASTSLEVKIGRIVSGYLDMLLENPELPLFVLNELRKKPDLFRSSLHLDSLIRIPFS